MNSVSNRVQLSRFRKAKKVLVFGLIAVMSIAASAHAADWDRGQEKQDWHNDGQQTHSRDRHARYDQEWREHEYRTQYYRRHRSSELQPRVVYAPPVVYEAPEYYSPPSYEQSGLNLIIPFNIR